MRRGHDGLVSVVRDQWRMDPFGDGIFVFVGKRADRVKILYWDRGGFVLVYKRLERGRFSLPKVPEGERRVRLDATDLGMLLDGIDWSRVRRPELWEPAKKVA